MLGEAFIQVAGFADVNSGGVLYAGKNVDEIKVFHSSTSLRP